MIRLGNNSWIVQNKKNKFGLIDNTGKELVPIKYLHADRVVSKFAKFGNSNDYGIYDEFGNVVVEPIYSKVDILFGKMFLTYKNYKYGIVGYDGKVILENEFDDIYKFLKNSYLKSNCKYNLITVSYLAQKLDYNKNQIKSLGIDDDTLKKVFNALPLKSKIKILLKNFIRKK